MANWGLRVVVGAAVVLCAPLSARFAVSDANGNNSQAASVGSGHEQPAGTSQSPGGAGSHVALDLTNPRTARTVAEAETASESQRALCEFLVLYGGSQKLPPKAETPTNTPEPGGAPQPQICGNLAAGSVEAMIAILPDPVRTHLALRFDRGIDDIENSAQQLGWRFSKAWLPWPNGETAAASRFQDRYVDAQMEDQREEQPGLLLFRGGGNGGNRNEATKPLIVLIVGDTPTGGVNAAQFRTAVGMWRWLRTNRETTCPGTNCTWPRQRLMLLGPTFSGSAASLTQLVNQELVLPFLKPPCGEGSLEVAIASGTMTSGTELEELRQHEGACGKDVDVEPVSFSVDIEYLRSHLLRFLDNKLPKREVGIAQISEDESEFGARAGEDPNSAAENSLEEEQHLLELVTKNIEILDERLQSLSKAHSGSSDRGGNDQLVKQRDTLKSDALGLQKDIDRKQSLVATTKELFQKRGKPSASEAPGFVNWLRDLFGIEAKRAPRPYLQLSFPRGISLLREAYEQNGVLGFGKGSGNAPKTELQLDFKEGAVGGDAVTTFSGMRGASAMESRMAQIASTLEKEKTGVALLSATDVLDEIFVARYLRAHAPSVTIVIEDADLLFLRGGADAALDGIYIVSPYPLIPRNGVWSTDMGGPLPELPTVAESQGDEGIAHASKYLLCGGDRDASASAASSQRCGWKPRAGFDTPYLWMEDYESPFPVPAAWDNDYKLQPPLWLSVIGHGGLQPISLIDIDEHDLKLPESGSTSLPRLGTVTQPPGQVEQLVPDTHPIGIVDEPLIQLRILGLSLFLLLLWHGWACTRCRLDRSFAWSYAAADVKPWPMRLFLQLVLNLLGIYAVSLLWIHSMPGLEMESTGFKAILIAVQSLLVILSVVIAWRSAAGGGTKTIHTILLGVVILVTVGFVLLADCWLWQLFGPGAADSSERKFFFYRSASLLSGSSPLVPLFLLLLALALWVRGRFAKMVFYGYRIPKLPSFGEEYRCPCESWVTELNVLLAMPLWERVPGGKPIVNWLKVKLALLSIACVLGSLALSRQLGPHTLAYSHFDLLIDLLSMGVAIATIHNLLVSFVAWRMLKNYCLIPLKQSPLRWGFNWIRGFSWQRLWTSPENLTSDAQLEYVIRNVEADRRGAAVVGGETAVVRLYKQLLTAYNSHDATVAAAPRWQRATASAQWAENVASTCQALYISLAKRSDRKIERLARHWKHDHGPLTGPETERGYHELQSPEKIETDADRRNGLQRMADEEFVAMVYLSYIRSVLVQIRNRIGTSAGLYILLLWALTGYPWMNHHGILLQLSALLVLLAAVSITIYAEMQKDDILSRTTETKSGKLDSDFFSRILSVVGIPLLTLVASQFPELSNAIFSWLVPSLSNVK